jgi:hypothetical protein
MSIKILTCHPIFNECALVLSKKTDYPIEQDFNPQSGDLYIVFGGHEVANELLQSQEQRGYNFGYVILNSEQIHGQFLKNKYYLQLMKKNIVMDYSELNANYLKEIHQIKVLSFYFFEFMCFQNLYEDRKYDVCFVGSPTEYRKSILEELQKSRPDLTFYIDLEWKNKDVASMTETLQQSKIVLNIPYHSKDRALETHRINKALSCGCNVLSMLSDDEDANTFYKDYIYMSNDLKVEMNKYFSFPNKYFNPPSPKKPYEELVKDLANKIYPHMYFVIKQIHQRLISLHTPNDDTTTEVVPEQTTTAGGATDETEATTSEPV